MTNSYVAKHLTPRQIQFLNGLDKGMTPADAYRAAGGKGGNPVHLASKMLAQPLVRVERDRRLAEATAQAKLTGDKIIARWEDLYDTAKQNNDSVTVARVLENQGKITGLYVERTEDLTKSKILSPDDATKIITAVLTALTPLLTAHNVPESQAIQALRLVFSPSAKAA